MNVVGIVGNPRTPSRTGALVEAALQRCEAEGCQRLPLIDLADGEPNEARLARVGEATILVVATPTYKASITGLLKSFLDRFPDKGLKGKIALPLMVGGAPNHSLALEYALKPVLSELGALVVGGLYILDANIDKESGRLAEAAAAPLAEAVATTVRVARALA